MIIVRVQYTAKQEYVAKNKENIQQVMQDLQAIGNNDIRYSTYILEDGKTFMHFAMFGNDEARSIFNAVTSFKKFQTELKESMPEVPPKVDHPSLVGSSYHIFG